MATDKNAVKAAVAAHVQRHVLGHVQEMVEALGLEDASRIDISPVTELQTMIRIAGAEGSGPRYFLVQVKEMI